MTPKSHSPLVVRLYFLVVVIVVKALFSQALEAKSIMSENTQDNNIGGGDEMQNSELSNTFYDNNNNKINNNERICVYVRERPESAASGVLCYYELSPLPVTSDEDLLSSMTMNPVRSRSSTFNRLRRTLTPVDWASRLKRPPMPFRIGGGLRSHSNRRIIIESN